MHCYSWVKWKREGVQCTLSERVKLRGIDLWISPSMDRSSNGFGSEALCWAAARSASSVVQTDAVCEATLEGIGSSLWGGGSAREVSEAGGWQGALAGTQWGRGQRGPEATEQPF